jgi:recombinational DNA repair protein (RecF pathway)
MMEINHNAEYRELEAMIEGRLCAECGQPPQIARLYERYRLICGCPAGPFIAPRETQAQFLRRREQELRDQTRALPSLSEAEATEMTRDLFGGG